MADRSVYWHIVRAQVRAQTQYRTSFILELIGSMVLTAVDVGTVFVLFSVADSLGGFGGGEVLLMAALCACAFPLADLVVGNIDRLRDQVRSGRFDSILLRPLPTLPQLAAVEFAPRRIGRATQGLAFYVVVLCVVDLDWNPATAVMAVVAPIAGAVFFGSLFVAGASVAFWWIDSGEVANGFTYGGRDFASYPITMYGEWMRALFAFGLGFAFVAYLPALALLGRSDPLGAPDWLRWCSPLTALIAATAAGSLWRAGVRHYRSTGS